MRITVRSKNKLEEQTELQKVNGTISRTNAALHFDRTDGDRSVARFFVSDRVARHEPTEN